MSAIHRLVIIQARQNVSARPSSCHHPTRYDGIRKTTVSAIHRLVIIQARQNVSARPSSCRHPTRQQVSAMPTVVGTGSCSRIACNLYRSCWSCAAVMLLTRSSHRTSLICRQGSLPLRFPCCGTAVVAVCACVTPTSPSRCGCCRDDVSACCCCWCWWWRC